MAARASAKTVSEVMGLKNFELENKIVEVSEADAIFKYDADKHQQLLAEKPWATNPSYFKYVKVSALALLKMVMHARSGHNLEVMGLLQGKVEPHTIIIMDVFALPVEGTETRVSAQDEAYNYMFSYLDLIKRAGRLENVIGWYHSHPGYGCWLSGIDVATQLVNQEGQDPFLAVVVDPTRTVASGKVELGAFRCYPHGYLPPDKTASEYQTIPLDKIEDFGVHVNSYYPLQVSYFKSALDSRLLESLWHKYWVNTLSTSLLSANADYTTQQVRDISKKLNQAEKHLVARSTGFHAEKKTEESQLAKCSRDSAKVTMETVHGLVAHLLKDHVFNRES
eukprot:m.237672 g.237672  ORF g.237672 m.237672 type:complete len:337 (-) comp13179_c0_seq1:84-1094(-)